jgi:hypothetical protein
MKTFLVLPKNMDKKLPKKFRSDDVRNPTVQQESVLGKKRPANDHQRQPNNPSCLAPVHLMSASKWASG